MQRTRRNSIEIEFGRWHLRSVEPDEWPTIATAHSHPRETSPTAELTHPRCALQQVAECARVLLVDIRARNEVTTASPREPIVISCQPPAIFDTPGLDNNRRKLRGDSRQSESDRWSSDISGNHRHRIRAKSKPPCGDDRIPGNEPGDFEFPAVACDRTRDSPLHCYFSARDWYAGAVCNQPRNRCTLGHEIQWRRSGDRTSNQCCGACARKRARRDTQTDICHRGQHSSNEYTRIQWMCPSAKRGKLPEATFRCHVAFFGLWYRCPNRSTATEVHVRRGFATAAATAFLLLYVPACASSSGGTGPSKVRESSPDRITSVEIEAQPGAQTAYDLVRRLRPRWLTAGATGSIGGGRVSQQVLLVYLDGNRLGTVESLRTLTASGIKSMQYYDAVRAATILREVGSEPISGAIVISTTTAQ